MKLSNNKLNLSPRVIENQSKKWKFTSPNYRVIYNIRNK